MFDRLAPLHVRSPGTPTCSIAWHPYMSGRLAPLHVRPPGTPTPHTPHTHPRDQPTQRPTRLTISSYRTPSLSAIAICTGARDSIILLDHLQLELPQTLIHREVRQHHRLPLRVAHEPKLHTGPQPLPVARRQPL